SLGQFHSQLFHLLHGLPGTVAWSRLTENFDRRQAIVTSEFRRTVDPVATRESAEGNHAARCISHVPVTQLSRQHAFTGFALNVYFFHPAAFQKLVHVIRTIGVA